MIEGSAWWMRSWIREIAVPRQSDGSVRLAGPRSDGVMAPGELFSSRTHVHSLARNSASWSHALLAPAAAPYLTLASYVSFDAQRFAEESWVVPSAARSSIVAVTSLPAWPASANV